MAEAPSLSPAHEATLREVFSTLDRNGSMSLELKEIGILMNKWLGKNLDDPQLMEIMTEVCDSDAPGLTMDFDTFCKAMAPVMANSAEEINKRAFATLDSDGSGCVSATELAPLMSAMAGGKMTTPQVQEVLGMYAGADGKVRYEDFVRAVTAPARDPKNTRLSHGPLKMP